MDNANARTEEQSPGPETPEDVAILYSWANLPGAKYRDFSASRREYRAQQRARVAEAQRQTELKAARDLEEAARREIESAQREVEETRRAEAKAAADAAQAAADAEAKRRAEEVLRRAEERAERERQEALRRQQSAEELRVLAERAQQEMLEARKRAEEQAARYAESDGQPKVHVSQQARVLPGQMTDPYYYSGPVDPAYFASTPGVRTAQATRVSTERKSYVYPVHPGSDEYDSGTIVALRGNHPFAPSPAQERVSPLQEVFPDRSEPAEREVPSPPVVKNPYAEYDLDHDYYDGDHVTRVFTPFQGRYTEGRETAPADLHIRPASRVSGDHEQQVRSMRPSPVPQLAAALDRLSAAAAQGQEQGHSEPVAPAPHTAAADTSEAEVQVHAAATDSSRDAHFRASSGEPPSEPLTHVLANEPGLPNDDTSARPLPGEADEDRGSRMFIPSPRRRVPQLDALRPRVAEQRMGLEPTPAEVRTRDAAAVEGRRRAQAEIEVRAAQDRFVQEQQVGEADTDRSSTSEAAPGPVAKTEGPTRHDEPMQWNALNRTAENGYRRRRQPAREPMARTARQPRVPQEANMGTEGQSAGEPAAPPAWLSGERPAARLAEGAKQDAVAAASPESPATPGDPSVPAPRQLPRRQPSGLRPRAQTPSASVLPVEPSPEPGALSSGRKQAQARGAEAPQTPGDQAPATDTLQQSRERVASRWFALSGLMESEGRAALEPRAGIEPRAGLRSAPHPAPMLCVLSISGGVGKTSIVATLGRALSSLGEKVMLADTNTHGILPYYFGAREQRPGAVRTFSPPPGSSDAPVVLVSYDADGRGYDEAGQTRVLDDLYGRANSVQRVLVDAGVNSAWLARTVAGTNPWVLVPVAPDMNSVLGTQAVERLFQDVTGGDGRPVKPYYVLNLYDPTVPLHLDVREVLRQFLGERLLPIMLHRTSAVSEALAEGMTVIDYAPRTPIANDYMNLAVWVRKLADPGLSYTRPARWSER